MLGWWDNWPSKRVYYIEDCWILRAYCPKIYTVSPRQTGNWLVSLCAGFTGHEGENMWTLSFTVSKKAVKRWEYGWAATYTTYKCKQSKPRLLLIKRMPNWVQSTLGAHYTQYPIIRNGDQRPLVEFLKIFQISDSHCFLF